MRHLLHILLYLSFQLNGQDATLSKTIYYNLDSIDIKAKFKSPPHKSKVRQDKDVMTQSYASQDNETYYGIEIINSTNYPNPSDSVNEFEYFANKFNNQAKGSFKGKVTKFKKGAFKNRPSYSLDFDFQEQYENHHMTSIIFFYKNNIVRAFVANPLNRTDKKYIDAFFDSIILGQSP